MEAPFSAWGARRPALFWRIWVLYRANLPPERYYQVSSLFEAPNPASPVHRAAITDHEAISSNTAGDAKAETDRQYGKPGTDAFEISQQMFQNAQKEGRLIPVSQGGRHG